MHRALKAILLIALMLGYVLPQSGRSETFCLVTLDVCACESESACEPCGMSSADDCEDHSESPCCLDLEESLDEFVLEGLRSFVAASFLCPVSYGDDHFLQVRPLEVLRVRPPAPPPPLVGRLLFRECERILV